MPVLCLPQKSSISRVEPAQPERAASTTDATNSQVKNWPMKPAPNLEPVPSPPSARSKWLRTKRSTQELLVWRDSACSKKESLMQWQTHSQTTVKLLPRHTLITLAQPAPTVTVAYEPRRQRAARQLLRSTVKANPLSRATVRAWTFPMCFATRISLERLPNAVWKTITQPTSLESAQVSIHQLPRSMWQLHWRRGAGLNTLKLCLS